MFCTPRWRKPACDSSTAARVVVGLGAGRISGGMTAPFERSPTESLWRRTALHTWGRPRDPSVYGFLELDASAALRWIEDARSASGAHVTITHVVGAAVARAIAAEPATNAIVRRGRLWRRRTVDVFFQVVRDEGEDLLGAKIDAADGESPIAIARALGHQAAKVRAHRAGALDKSGSMLGALPERLVGPAMRLIELLTYDVGLDLRAIDVPFDAFGSAMVTNVGTFGLPNALVPLVPFSRTPILVSVGAIRSAAVVVGQKVEVRPVLSIGVTLDHRVLDGAQAGRLATRFSAAVEDPFVAFGEPRALAARRGDVPAAPPPPGS